MARFADRAAAGRELAELLAPAYAGRVDLIVLALPRGGVPVAAPVASRLGAPLDVVLVRKLGAPWQPELGLGAIATGGGRVLDRRLVDRLGVSAADLAAIIERETAELARQEVAYRGDRPVPDLSGRTVLLVDDGVATGSSLRAGALAIRAAGAAAVVAAAPCGPPDAARRLAGACDQVVLAATPAEFRAVGQCYDDFSATTDDEVRALLSR